MKNDKLPALIVKEGLFSENLIGTAVTGKDKELLLDIKSMLDVFAVIGEDDRRGLWMEFPGDDYDDGAHWYYITVSCYQGHTYLCLSDNEYICFVIHDDSSNPARIRSKKALLTALKEHLLSRIPHIASDVNAYNDYVEQNLPRRQRIGHIARKDLNRIVPWYSIMPNNPDKCIQVLKQCIANEELYKAQSLDNAYKTVPQSYRAPLSNMNKYVYAKYLRIAQKVYDEHFDSFHKEFQENSLEGMRLFAKDCFKPGEWVFYFELQCSSWLDVFMEVAVALYDSGCPLVIRDAQRFLDILEERGDTRIALNSNPNVISCNEAGSFPLPDESCLDEMKELSREQYDQIVALARWDQEIPVALAT